MVALPKALVRRLAKFCTMTIPGSYYQDRLWITRCRSPVICRHSVSTLAVPTAVNLGTKGWKRHGRFIGGHYEWVMDALSTAGVSAFEMPATPCRVWEALQAKS